MRHRWLLSALLLVSASGVLQAQSDSALSRNIQKDVDSISLNPRLNQRSKRALLRIDARADTIRLNPNQVDTVKIVRVDTVHKVDTVYVTKPDTVPSDTTHPPIPPDSITHPDTVYSFVHPYPPPTNGAAFAEFPRETVTVVVPTPSRTVTVQSLQQALDTAQTGDLLKIPANHTDNCLVVKPTARQSWVTVQGTDSTSVITCAAGGAVSTIGIQSQAHHVRFLGPLSIRAATDATNAIVRSFNGETSRAQLAHDFIWDGVTVDSRGFQVRRCFWPDGIRMAIVNSKALGCASKGGDAQAIIVLNGGGPYRFTNNYLEGGHQCFMSGGGDPSIKGDKPSDIYFAYNTCVKPLYWHYTTPGVYTGLQRQVKTIIETKNIRRALFEYNVLRNVWADAQAGFCWLLKSTNQDGTDSTAQTVDVTARYNRCVNVENGINLAAHPQGGIAMTRVSFYGNYTDTISTNGQAGINFQMLDDLRDMILMHNTFTAAGNTAITFDGAFTQRSVITGNILYNGLYGVKGNSTGSGNATLNKWVFPSGQFDANIIVGAGCSVYPPGTICTLPATIPNAPDGTPIGADLTKIPK